MNIFITTGEEQRKKYPWLLAGSTSVTESQDRHHSHLILLQWIYTPAILAAAYTTEVNSFLCLCYLSSTSWLKSWENRHRWLQQSVSCLHYYHLSATHKEAKCHIIGRCVKSFPFQLCTKALSSLFLPSLFFNTSPDLLQFISLPPGCHALLRCIVLHETYDNASWLASSHSNYGCLLLWWTPHPCRRATDPQPHGPQLFSHHVWAFVYSLKFILKNPTFTLEGLLECTHTPIKKHSTFVHIGIYNIYKWSAVDSVYGLQWKKNQCLVKITWNVFKNSFQWNLARVAVCQNKSLMETHFSLKGHLCALWTYINTCWDLW